MDYDGLTQLLRNRVSVRTYADRDVDEDDIRKLVEAARWAPTSCNRQSWKVVVVKRGARPFDLLAGANYGGVGFAAQAPVLLLVVVDLRTYWLPSEMNYPISDGSIAAFCLMLAATSLGLTTCWVSWQAATGRRDAVYAELGLAPYLYPVCVLTVGYPAESAGPIPREDAAYYTIRSQSTEE
jgi:nitroreductase